MKAYVLVGLLECDERKLLELFSKMPEVKEARILFGEWDLILLIEAEDAEQLGSFVMEKIRKLPEVKITSTLIVAG